MLQPYANSPVLTSDPTLPLEGAYNGQTHTLNILPQGAARLRRSRNLIAGARTVQEGDYGATTINSKLDRLDLQD